MLPSPNAPPLAGTTPPVKHKRRAARRSEVHDSATWFKAWNQYLVTRVAVSALPLVKYQTLMMMLHAPSACIEYDRLFRQTAATTPSTRWDRLKEDVFVWALGRCRFYVDTCLPFCLRSAPFLFNEVAKALEWILKHNYAICHYLDDYSMAGPPTAPTCAHHLQRFLRVADRLGVLVTMEKVDVPTTTLTVLGQLLLDSLLDSVQQVIRLPPGKLAEIHQELNLWSSRRSTTKRELFSLLGKLSFAARAVPAGRLFLHRLISLSTSVTQLHHHIRLNADARADISWWRASWNGTAPH